MLADEINRATPRTQSAFLEAMEERGVTVDGVTHSLPAPFVVLATQNPVELKGTFPLPEAQVDRFLLALRMGYPEADDEAFMLERFRADDPLAEVRPVVAPEQVAAARAAVRAVHVADDVARYVVALARATRESPRVRLGASPRASLALQRAAQASAALDGRDFVVPDDVQALAEPVLAHRLLLARDTALAGETAGSVLRDLLREVPVPAEPGRAAPPREAGGTVRLRSVLWVCLLGLVAAAVLRSPALAFATLAASAIAALVILVRPVSFAPCPSSAPSPSCRPVGR